MSTLAILKSLHTLDNRQFIRGLSDSEKRSRRVGQRIGREARNMSRRFRTLTGNVFNLRTAFATLAGTAGVGLLIRQQLKAIDSTAKLADRLNLTTQELTALHRVTELNGESTERMDKSLEAMSRRVGQAAEGFGQAERALDQLGLSAEELSDMGMAQQFETISREIAKVENANTRASIAADLFSRQGIGLLNTMDALAEQGLAPTIERLEQTGEAFDRIDAAKVEAANDAVTQMRGSFTGIARIITIEIAGPLRSVAESMDQAVTGSEDFQDSVREMTRSAVRGVASVIDVGASVISFVEQNATMAQFGLVGYVLLGKKGAAIGGVIGTLLDGIERRMASFGVGVSDNVAELIKLEDRVDSLQGRLENLPEGGREFRQVEKDLRESRAALEEVREAAQPEELREYADAWDKTGGSVGGMADGARSLADVLRSSLGPEIRTMEEELAQLDRTASGGGLAPDGDEGGGDSIDDMRAQQEQRLDLLRDRLSTEAELEQRRFDEHREFLDEAHEELFEDELERKEMLAELERQHEARKREIQAEGQGQLLRQQMQFLSLMEKAQRSSGATQVGIMSNAFAQITAAGAQHNKKMFEMNKAAGIANAIVSTYQGMAKALEWGWPMGPIFAGLIGASGFAKVSAIQSQSFSGSGGAAPSASAGGGVPAVQDVGRQQQQDSGAQQTQEIIVDMRGSRSDDESVIGRVIEEIDERVRDGMPIGGIRLARSRR